MLLKRVLQKNTELFYKSVSIETMESKHTKGECKIQPCAVESNPKMISSTPELLEALMLVMENTNYNDIKFMFGGGRNHWTKKVEQAIKKATNK